MNINLGKKTLEIGNAGDFVDATDGLNMKEKILLNATLYMAYNGMNENGLGIAMATAFSSSCKDTDKPDLYDRAITTAVLSNASNVDEAIAFLEDYDAAADYPLSHYMIVDTEGNVAVVEWIDGEMVVIHPDMDYMIMSNFPLTTMKGYGIDRYNSYKDALGQCGGVLTEKEALKLLAENVIPNAGCWSVVYNLTDRTATVCFRANYNNSYTYTLDK
jgi:predicted choloylglycine hydrolase